MRFSAVMIVLNGMPWLPYIMKNIYPHVDEWVIVEGAQRHVSSIADPNGHSLDNTLEFIKNFPDPDRKIRLIQRDGHWQDRDEMFAVGTENLRGDYLWQVDMDEFYKAQDIHTLKQFLGENPQIEAVSVRSYDFFGGIHGYIMGEYAYCGYQRWRFWRWQKGYQYIRHEPPTVVTAEGADVRTKGFVTGQELQKRFGIVCYHYSYVLPEQVRLKSLSEAERNLYPKNNFIARPQDEIRSWYENHYVRFTPWEVSIKPTPSWLEPYWGNHPAEAQALFDDIAQGKLPIKMREGDEIDRFLATWWRWRFWQTVGLVGLFYHNWIKPLLRPIVRWVRSTFWGYDYRAERKKEAEQRALRRSIPWHD